MNQATNNKPKITNFRFRKIPIYLGNVLHSFRRLYYKYGPLALIQKICIHTFNDHKSAWSLGRNHELSYWKKALSFEFYKWPEGELEFRINPSSELQAELAELIPHPSPNAPKILDVGCGPVTSLGKNVHGHKIDMACIDPLADDYATITSGTEFEPLVKPQAIPGEEIYQHFAADYFDLAHAKNSLDHAYDPAQIVRQMLWTVKPGACVYLYHLVNEADRNEHKGLHQWNFFSDKGSFIIADNQRTINLSKSLSEYADITCTQGDEKKLPWLIVTMKKRVSFDL